MFTDYEKIYIGNRYENIKNKKVYLVTDIIINCTNKNDGQIMVVYTDYDKKYCREINEFRIKFRIEGRIINMGVDWIKCNNCGKGFNDYQLYSTCEGCKWSYC